MLFPLVDLPSIGDEHHVREKGRWQQAGKG